MEFFKRLEDLVSAKRTCICIGLDPRVDPADPTFAAARTRLAATREARRKQAAAYFSERAADWDAIRALHASESRVEAAIVAMVGDKPICGLLDLGAGTGRMLELLAPRADRAVGVDQSPAMLAVARARIGESGLRNVQLRQGDLYAPPVERDSYDLVVIHQVLHFLDDPARALAEAARALRPSGRLLVVDFVAHAEEFLRQAYAHRRLGFTDDEIASFIAEAGLTEIAAERVAPAAGESNKLTVALWLARDRRIIADPLPKPTMELA